jgi:hypothetical protein
MGRLTGCCFMIAATWGHIGPFLAMIMKCPLSR